MGKPKLGRAGPQSITAELPRAASVGSLTRIKKCIETHPEMVDRPCPVVELTPLLISIVCGQVSAGETRAELHLTLIIWGAAMGGAGHPAMLRRKTSC